MRKINELKSGVNTKTWVRIPKINPDFPLTTPQIFAKILQVIDNRQEKFTNLEVMKPKLGMSMSNFQCDLCGEICCDMPQGYIAGCEHYPVDAPNEAASE
jgi:hypothetical protein